MRYIFLIACIIMLIKLATRKIDFYTVGALCHMVYNIYCFYGYVFISSHESKYQNYYSGFIDTRVYFIVLLQMTILFLVITFNDRLNSQRESDKNEFIIDNLDENTKKHIFHMVCIVAWIIMLYNIVKIGPSNLRGDKSSVWSSTSVLYVTGNWLGMAVYVYALRNKKILLAILGLAPVLLHIFIGSRAYFAAVMIFTFLNYGSNIKKSMIKHLKLIILGILCAVGILAYKKIYLLVKAGDFSQALTVLRDPETYAYVLRFGEPRIVLANLNYIIENGIKLGIDQIYNRIIAFIPFADNFLRIGEYTPVSQILGTEMNSSYGLASNIWGEFYAIGSYLFLFVMFIVWLGVLKWGNNLLYRKDWSSCFYLPFVCYVSFYIHRMDFVKVIGNFKMVVMAIILFELCNMIVSHKAIVLIRRKTKRV